MKRSDAQSTDPLTCIDLVNTYQMVPAGRRTLGRVLEGVMGPVVGTAFSLWAACSAPSARPSEPPRPGTAEQSSPPTGRAAREPSVRCGSKGLVCKSPQGGCCYDGRNAYCTAPDVGCKEQPDGGFHYIGCDDGLDCDPGGHGHLGRCCVYPKQSAHEAGVGCFPGGICGRSRIVCHDNRSCWSGPCRPDPDVPGVRTCPPIQ